MTELLIGRMPKVLWGERKLHHRFGEPGGSTEGFCGVPNILCRFGVDIARCIEHHVDCLGMRLSKCAAAHESLHGTNRTN
jgi:hypothetical protein